MGLVGTAALAQATNHKAVEATVGKPVQLGYYASVHENSCTPAQLPTIRIVETPKSRTPLTVRRAELTTNNIQGRLGLKVRAQIAFYQRCAGGTGADHLDYEVTNENGEVASYDFPINIKEAPKAPPAANKDLKF